jgi:hypothetical protein
MQQTDQVKFLAQLMQTKIQPVLDKNGLFEPKNGLFDYQMCKKVCFLQQGAKFGLWQIFTTYLCYKLNKSNF